MTPSESSAAVRPNRHNRAFLLAILAITSIGFALLVSAYWPGVMIDDARWQYQQAVDNAYEDWHPPMMAWIWHHLLPLKAGPAPMLLLQALIFWTGIGLIAVWLYRHGKPTSAVAAALVGWLPAPFALLGSVTKDSLMAGTLVCAAGTLLWARSARHPLARRLLPAVTLIVLLFAASLRVNAFLACTPLAIGVLPAGFTRTIPRFIVTALALTAIFLAVPGVVAKALQAEDTDAELSLIIFDLGGITEHTGVSQFPDLNVRNPVAVNRGCYDPHEWDSYSSWAKRPCPLGFDRFQSLVDEGDIDPRMLWLKAIAAHPVAYAEHRLAHFNLSTWSVVPDNPVPTAWVRSVANPWGFQVKSNPALTTIDSIADATAVTPLGWPIFWIAMSLGILMFGRAAKLSGGAIAIAASAFLYGAGYLVFGVATGMRYYQWTIAGAGIAVVLAADEFARSGRRVDRPLCGLTIATVIVPTAIAAMARIGI